MLRYLILLNLVINKELIISSVKNSEIYPLIVSFLNGINYTDILNSSNFTKITSLASVIILYCLKKVIKKQIKNIFN